MVRLLVNKSGPQLHSPIDCTGVFDEVFAGLLGTGLELSDNVRGREGCGLHGYLQLNAKLAEDFSASRCDHQGAKGVLVGVSLDTCGQLVAGVGNVFVN